MVVLHTNHGDITLELDTENSPATVANFLEYVRAGHYDNTLFHRVIPGFMIQGGGFAPGMQQKPTRAPVANEAANGVKNTRYTVAMARTCQGAPGRDDGSRLEHEAILGDAVVFHGVSRYVMRVKCAMLAWVGAEGCLADVA